MNKQYEIAKITCKKWISDEVIERELTSLSHEEWNEQCTILDGMMKEHVKDCQNEADKANVMLEDLISTGKSISVDEVTVWVAYLKWLEVEYTVSDKV